VCAKASEKIVLEVAGHEVAISYRRGRRRSRSVVTSARLIVEYLLQELDENVRVRDQNRLRL
jgi:hypothetical protein